MTFMRRSIVGLAVLAALLPASGFAKETTLWDFSNSKLPGEWNVQNVATQISANGLLIQPQGDGFIVRETFVTHPVEELELNISQSGGGQIFIMWHAKNTPVGSLSQFAVDVQASDTPTTISLNVRNFPNWDTHADFIGLGFSANSPNIILRSVGLTDYSLGEEIGYAWNSFWTYDQFLSYSINFLWGPLITYTEAGQTHLFDTQPPIAQSANRLFFFVLILTAVILLALGLWKRIGENEDIPWKKGTVILCIVFGLLWLVYDFRMGTEVLTYSIKDIGGYVTKPVAERKLRNYEEFYGMMEWSLPDIQKNDRFGLLTPSVPPLTKIARYMAYPSVPLFDGEQLNRARVWVVFRRDDVRVTASGALMAGTTELAKQGEVIQTFGEHSFIYRTK